MCKIFDMLADCWTCRSQRTSRQGRGNKISGNHPVHIISSQGFLRRIQLVVELRTVTIFGKCLVAEWLRLCTAAICITVTSYFHNANCCNTMKQQALIGVPHGFISSLGNAIIVALVLLWNALQKSSHSGRHTGRHSVVVLCSREFCFNVS